MRKRTIIILTVISALLLWPSVNINAISEIPLEATYIDPTHDQGDPHRGPVLVPEVSIEGYTLFFGTPCDGSVLRLLDEDGYVVYSTVIPTGTTTLPLPTTLSGDYELQIIRDGWCFYGWIEL